MKVLIDRHHSDLWESWELLFTDRWGWDLYAPFGMDWFTEGIWNFERAYHGDAVARQYLSGWWEPWDTLRHKPEDRKHLPLWVERTDPTHPGRVVKGIVLGTARQMEWDLIISTLPDNDIGLYNLARQTGAKFGIQLGNVGQQSAWHLADFALCSTTLPGGPPINDTPFVIYRQPFSLTDFRYEPPGRRWEKFRISSFVQCLPENPMAYAQFLHYARSADDFDWRIYGSYGSHDTDEYAAGNVSTTRGVASEMRASDVIWHTKEWSDGYGHVIHNAFATGRPVFGIEPYYADKLAGPLWVDGVTSIDISRRSPDEVLGILRRLREDPEEHLRMSEAASARFREIVDFDAEADQVKALLDNVLSDRRVAA
jgi:hypothetical protein